LEKKILVNHLKTLMDRLLKQVQLQDKIARETRMESGELKDRMQEKQESKKRDSFLSLFLLSWGLGQKPHFGKGFCCKVLNLLSNKVE